MVVRDLWPLRCWLRMWTTERFATGAWFDVLLTVMLLSAKASKDQKEDKIQKKIDRSAKDVGSQMASLKVKEGSAEEVCREWAQIDQATG